MSGLKLGVEELGVEELGVGELGVGELGVGELGVGELGVEELRKWVSGGVSGGGHFSECFATDFSTHQFLLPTPLSFHYFHTDL